MKRNWKRGIVLAAILVLIVGLMAAAADAFPNIKSSGDPGYELTAGRRKTTPTPKPSKTPKPSRTAAPAVQATPTPESKSTKPTLSPVPDGPIIEPQAITDWLFSHDFTLPDNFITKKQAQALGWDSSYNYLSDVAPGMSIGGDRFGNYEGQLPSAKGRRYTECDCYYVSGKRNAYRIVFSNDGLVFYTEDHYNTFIQMFPSDAQPGEDP